MDEINPTILKTTIEDIPILTEENFSSWKTRITALFKLGGLKDPILNGEPALDDSDNTILCAIILAKLSATTHNNMVTFLNKDDALALWKDIIKRFVSTEPSNRARVYNQFASISFDSSNIEKFITEVRSTIVKMEDVGIKMDKDILTYDLLKRLPSILENIKQSITHSKNGEDIHPNALLDHLEIHLNELKVSSVSKVEVTSMFTKEDPQCIPGKHNPYSESHTKDRCWFEKPHLRPKYPYKSGNNYEKNGNNVSRFSTFSFNHPSVFILDSGSTSHMVSDQNFFITLDETERGMINTSCGPNTLAIEGKGSISMLFSNQLVVLHDVLLVPKITVNLLSLHRLILDQCKIHFDTNNFIVLKDDKPFLSGHYHNNLPVIQLKARSHHSSLSVAEKLHKSLGHVSYSRIRNKLGIPITPQEVCRSCAVSKITRASYKHRSSRASRPLEELHLDLIGPIAPASHKQHKYILTIVDGNTRFCSAIPLASKCNVHANLTRVIDVEAKRLGYHPSILHSDRGTEFLNAETEEYCKTHAIRQTFSNAYTPQQNGLAERFNWTILESLRTVLLDSGFPRHFWNEVLGASILTLNQIPAHRSLKSPYELFKGQSIPLQFFHPVGNPVAVYSDRKKLKLDPRGEMGKLIGFDVDLKSYKIFTSNGRFVNSKNVVFLDFESNPVTYDNSDDFLKVEKIAETKPPELKLIEGRDEDRVKVEEIEEELIANHQEEEFESSEEETENEDEDVAQTLVPSHSEPVGRILRDHTLQVKPVKYSCLATDPRSFKAAVKGENSD
ncbi:hypothetical protein VP01_2730g1 [Puccinia sorghi]|uniref:Integrase catalytic domain-containing protein n=1 Tax=Puccinia sorghi TaxID=27349 RepID=A0A0L6V3X7_9BASI|nr:hypothetical protein VP01_2730g1 [Puccinia sorghi]